MKTVLVIDDEAAILEICGMALERKGFHVVRARSGGEGLEMAKRHVPDLVLCDINMPGMDGRGVLRTLRDDVELSTAQFVLMTGNPLAVPPRKGMELGADDFLTKPFTVEELLACVEARLRRAHVHWRVEERMMRDLRSTLSTTLPHEFFTPLSGIMGMTEILLSEFGNLDKGETLEILRDIDTSGKRLHRTLSHYFAILELEMDDGTSEAPRDLGPEEIDKAVHDAVERVCARHERRTDISLELRYGKCHAALNDLCTILDELIDNACSFSLPGTPVQVCLTDDGVFTIRDEGRGMTPEQTERIGAFRQFDRKRFEQQGLGLGLALTLGLVTRSKGRLSVESAPGEGTTVRLAMNQNR
ncbi:MAG: hybrid sensor histidine kinase/response regulator [Opitutales bacterium]|nr:hybrid sensor histidine kinase/response regulator [Opitutales bacterium]